MGRNKSITAPAEVILHRDLSTGQQLGMLLNVCANMTQVLLNPEREHENIPGQRSVDGEAHLAASNTFIKACDRLEAILEDNNRWGMEYQLALERQYNERHAEQMKLMAAETEAKKAQRAAAESISMPHFRYKPSLVPMDDGSWIAYLGNTDNLDDGILGVGDNPDAALRSFDDAFRGRLSPEVTAWLQQHEQNIEQGIETTTPFPKNTPNAKKLDGQRDENPERDAGGGHPSSGDSEDPGADTFIGS